jgi:hypothetical protein
VREGINSCGRGKRAQPTVTDATADNSISGESLQITTDEFFGTDRRRTQVEHAVLLVSSGSLLASLAFLAGLFAWAVMRKRQH